MSLAADASVNAEILEMPPEWPKHHDTPSMKAFYVMVLAGSEAYVAVENRPSRSAGEGAPDVSTW